MELVVNGMTLSHHGIKGQKWGVRNAEWYPIAAYKKSFKYKRSQYMKWQDRSMNREWQYIYTDSKHDAQNSAGVIRKDNTLLIKKGSELHRVATEDDKIDSKRKYVTLTSGDRELYKNYYQNIFIKDLSKPITEFTYNVDKTIKIAGNEYEIEDYIIEKFGNKKLKTAYEFAKEINWFNVDEDDFMKNELNVSEFKEMKEISDWSYEITDKVSDFIGVTLVEKIDDIQNEFIKRGYDAILDIQDADFADLPIILLDPKNNISEKSRDNSWKEKVDKLKGKGGS